VAAFAGSAEDLPRETTGKDARKLAQPRWLSGARRSFSGTKISSTLKAFGTINQPVTLGGPAHDRNEKSIAALT
jgi:hypothetical protein